MDRRRRGRAVYLDTHVTMWLHDGLVEKLTPAATAAIERGRLLVSGMVVLELQFLLEVGRVRVRPEAVIDHLEAALGLGIGDVRLAEVARRAAAFTWTRDPFDRLICAEAALVDGVLVSADAVMRRNAPNVVW